MAIWSKPKSKASEPCAIGLPPADAAARPAPPSLFQLTALFLRLGATAFGGPAAHIGLIEHEVVRRRRWIDATTFLDLLGAAMLLPGPTSTELAMYIGHRTRGWPGLLAAGASFITPAALLVAACAWLYTHGRSLSLLGP